mmetsp:Transcript_46209/g.142935  ORF Transcript_46209/g.142935 Transcript_46209/m.142935 type:complete len:250 (-) Transcript_46209:234-983(-)
MEPLGMPPGTAGAGAVLDAIRSSRPDSLSGSRPSLSPISCVILSICFDVTRFSNKVLSSVSWSKPSRPPSGSCRVVVGSRACPDVPLGRLKGTHLVIRSWNAMGELHAPRSSRGTESNDTAPRCARAAGCCVAASKLVKGAVRKSGLSRKCLNREDILAERGGCEVAVLPISSQRRCTGWSLLQYPSSKVAGTGMSIGRRGEVWRGIVGVERTMPRDRICATSISKFDTFDMKTTAWWTSGLSTRSLGK